MRWVASKTSASEGLATADLLVQAPGKRSYCCNSSRPPLRSAQASPVAGRFGILAAQCAVCIGFRRSWRPDGHSNPAANSMTSCEQRGGGQLGLQHRIDFIGAWTNNSVVAARVGPSIRDRFPGSTLNQAHRTSRTQALFMCPRMASVFEVICECRPAKFNRIWPVEAKPSPIWAEFRPSVTGFRRSVAKSLWGRTGGGGME